MAPRDTVTISVVEDDPSFLRALRRLLGVAGYRVATFGSAEEFLASGEVSTTACLILDINLGGMSGLELEQCLTARRTPIPTVFITGHDDALARERARTAGLYLRKPFREDALIGAIQQALAGPSPASF